MQTAAVSRCGLVLQQTRTNFLQTSRETTLLFNIGLILSYADFLKLHKFKENGDSCLPLLNIISDFTCTICTCIFHPSSIVLHFSVLALESQHMRQDPKQTAATTERARFASVSSRQDPQPTQY